MKTVYLLRHGKSDWHAEFGRDHDRPLARRGRRAAATIGRMLAAVASEVPEVVTSSATRARHTAELVVETAGWPDAPRIEPRLYGGGPETVLEAIRTVPEARGAVLLVGHEPTWSETASRLLGGGHLRVVTAALARIELPSESWRGVTFGSGTLIWLVPPKMLHRAGFDGGPEPREERSG